MEILMFTLGGGSFGVPVQDIVFIDRRTDNFAEESKESGYIKGTIVIRGLLMSVYNLALRLGFADQNLKYLIVVNVDGTNVGIEADTADGVIAVTEEEIKPVPVFMDVGQCCFKSVVTRGMRTIFVLDVNGLMDQKEKSEVRKIVDDNSRTLSVY